MDPKDPNYDSEEEEGNIVMVSYENEMEAQQQTMEANAKPQLQTSEFDTEVKLVILEYFQNGDATEVIDTLKCFNYDQVKSELIAFMVGMAFEHNNTCKELMSRLLRDLNLEVFVEQDFVNGFNLLIKDLDDLVIDNPDAAEVFKNIPLNVLMNSCLICK